MPTSEQLLTMDGVAVRGESVRFDLVAADLTTVQGEVHPRWGGARVEFNGNRTIKRQLSGVVFPADELADMDPFAARLRPVWVLSDGTEYPLGVFMLTDRTRRPASRGTVTEAAWADQAVMLDQPLPATVGAAAGSFGRDVLIARVQAAGLTRYNVDASDARLAEPRSWPVGSGTHWQVVADMATLCGFHGPYFDNAGVLQVRRLPELSQAVAQFDYDTPDRVYADSIVEADDYLARPNRYVAIDSAATEAALSAYADVPADAPYSVANRGFVVPEVVDVPGAGSIAALEAAARTRMQQATSLQWATWSAAPDPRHDGWNVIKWGGVLWREQSWALTLAPGGPHVHELRRSYAGG